MAYKLLIGTRKGLFCWNGDERGGSWDTPHFLGDRVAALATSPDRQTILAALDLGHFGGKIRRSRDAGVTWSETPVPTYPPRPDDPSDVEPNSQKPVPWNVELLWCLESGTTAKPGRFWCGTIPGGLFRSDDHGDSWSLVTSLWENPARRQWFGGGYAFPGIHSIAVDPRDDAKVVCAISCGGIWHSEDGGESWQVESQGMVAPYMPPGRQEDPLIQDPHRVVRCASAPEVMWCQHHGGMYRSTDAGHSWTALHPPLSSFGFAVAADPTDPARAWFVPAHSDEKRVALDGGLAVLRTQDGGKSFDVLRAGLPQQNTYDLIYRHALDVHASGKVVAFASTTGNVWLSCDSGERWQLIGGNLPPVACVRFV